MRRFSSMKIALASILSCLALMLGMFATTGTASAHTAGNHPFINASDFQRTGECVSFVLEGGDFTPNKHVDLFVSGGGSIDPDRVRADGDGNFLVDATACENFDEFSNCGGFIDTFNFCGFNLPQEDFCGVSGFDCSGFFGSTLKSLDCNPQQDPFCMPGQGNGNGPCSSPMPPAWCNQGQGNGGNPCNSQNPPSWCQQGQGNGGNPCHSQNPPSWCQQGQGNGGNPCNSQNPPSWCQQGQGNGGNPCHSQNPPSWCFPNNGGNPCHSQTPPPWCFQNHPHRFHIPLFNFCNFNFRNHRNEFSTFPFCFRFFPQQFALSFVITAVDEHTGKRAHFGLSVGGF
jgi:hypothetical protein